MSSLVRNLSGKLRWLLPVVAIATTASACELDVSDPSVIQTDELAGPPAVPTQIQGVIGDLANATEHTVLYGGMFTDEFILAGTFPTRLQVDERRVNFSNATITGEIEEGLQVARQQADNMVTDFEGFLGDEDFDQGDLRDGIAIGNYVGGLARLWLGEHWCNVAISEGATPVSSEQAVTEALAKFEAAETAAGEAGLAEWAEAARLGQARAHLFLGNPQMAADIASGVARSHRLFVEFSNNDPEQFNKVYDLNYGSQNEVIRWTVGDGGQASRQNEKFAEYDEFAALGIIDPDPDQDVFEAFDSSITTHLPLIYDEAPDDILISTGTYARLIEAEAAIRDGAAAMAADMIDDVRADFVARWSAERFRIDSEIETIDERANAEFGDDFENLTMEEQLTLLMGEYAREGWLAGTRQENLRRLVEEFGAGTAMDLYPTKPGDQICWPVSEQEETGATP